MDTDPIFGNYFVWLFCIIFLFVVVMLQIGMKQTEESLNLVGKNVLLRVNYVSGVRSQTKIFGQPAGNWAKQCLTLVCLEDRIMIRGPQLKMFEPLKSMFPMMDYDQDISYDMILECRVRDNWVQKSVEIIYKNDEGGEESSYILTLRKQRDFLDLLTSKGIKVVTNS